MLCIGITESSAARAHLRSSSRTLTSTTTSMTTTTTSTTRVQNTSCVQLGSVPSFSQSAQNELEEAKLMVEKANKLIVFLGSSLLAAVLLLILALILLCCFWCWPCWCCAKRLRKANDNNPESEDKHMNMIYSTPQKQDWGADKEKDESARHDFI